MSWGTCYSVSNNIHFDFPPIMSDGRNYASWQPGAVLSNEIKKNNNITKNWEYRKYMVDNADSIIKHNQISACNESSVCIHNLDNKVSNSLVYNKNLSKNVQYGYNNSDLKNIYISRQDLQSRMVTPVLSQEDLLLRGYKNSN
jgi:hypothetical protein